MVDDAPSVPPGARGIPVSTVLADPVLADGFTSVVEGAAQTRLVTHARIQKSGLALVGHHHGIVTTRVQVLGGTEASFLATLEAHVRADRCDAFCSLGLSVIIVTRGAAPDPALVRAAANTQTPLVVAKQRSSKTIAAIHSALDRLLAPTETVHAVLVEVHGVGMLIRGPSGIGKSECALSLLDRGHRLVADDRVILTRTPQGAQVIGSPPPPLRHHLEVRGVGILNARDLYGATAVCDATRVDLVIELCRPGEGEVERLGLDDLESMLLGVSIPLLRVPVQPGRNMAVIMEVAARNHLIRKTGRHPAREFIERLERGGR